MINPEHFQQLVIDPALEEIGMYSPEASQLLLGTAVAESYLTHLTQLDGDEDPYDDGLGVYQTERKTIDDIWKNYLRYRVDLSERVLKCCHFIGPPPAIEVIWNLRYATIMARLHYRRVKEPLPRVRDLEAQAIFWKKYYNTAGGRGTIDRFIDGMVRANLA